MLLIGLDQSTTIDLGRELHSYLKQVVLHAAQPIGKRLRWALRGVRTLSHRGMKDTRKQPLRTSFNRRKRWFTARRSSGLYPRT
jgi:hypothetical protein